jgi:hypothetical protein
MLHYVTNSDTGDYIVDMAEEYEDKYPVTYTKFEKQAADLLDKCLATLTRKDVEYAGHGDAFEAFKEAAKGENVIPEEIARRYRLKHDMSLRKLLADIQNGHDENLTEEFINEKIGDIICYTTLIYGMLMERIKSTTHD